MSKEEAKAEFLQEPKTFKIHLGADSSAIVPIKMINFEHFCLRPISMTSRDENNGEMSDPENEPPYDWSDDANFDLQNSTEKQLFEMKPITLTCKTAGGNGDDTDYGKSGDCIFIR